MTSVMGMPGSWVARVAVAVLGLAALVNPLAAQDPYPVYRAFLDSKLESTWASPLVIRPSTVSREYDSRTLGFLRRWIPEVDDALLQAAEAAGASEPDFLRLAPLDRRPAYFVSPSEREIPGFDELRRQYGESAVVVELSDVVFGGNQALFYYTFTCGPMMCSEGVYVVMEEGENGWSVLGQALAWAT